MSSSNGKLIWRNKSLIFSLLIKPDLSESYLRNICLNSSELVMRLLFNLFLISAYIRSKSPCLSRKKVQNFFETFFNLIKKKYLLLKFILFLSLASTLPLIWPKLSRKLLIVSGGNWSGCCSANFRTYKSAPIILNLCLNIVTTEPIRKSWGP